MSMSEIAIDCVDELAPCERRRTGVAGAEVITVAAAMAAAVSPGFFQEQPTLHRVSSHDDCAADGLQKPTIFS